MFGMNRPQQQQQSEATARQFTLNLTPDGKAQMICYLPKEPNGKAVVGIPGGGYAMLSNSHEGTLASGWMNEHGIAYFVVNYRLPQGDRTIPISDVEKGFTIVRDSATAWGINPQMVGIMGFSAGGHLASVISTKSAPAVRPNFSILFYPVISMDEKISHQNSCENFLGMEGKKDANLVREYSTNLQVKPRETPPAFLVLSSDDNLVPPVTNAVAYYTAMKQAGNECALFIYPNGGHGYGFGQWFAYRAEMLATLEKWLNNRK
ncbi:MAG: alpha/beta hydrolase [Bacteroidaceae bacterium]|nr:alpha/beta hydrolase [Bacteroidaceae bacterium]